MANDETRNERRAVINSSTLMPLGVVVALVLALWRGTTYLDSRFAQLAESDRVMTEQLTFIKFTLSDRWTCSDQKIWEQALQIKNPSIVVPDSTAILHARDVSINNGRRNE